MRTREFVRRYAVTVYFLLAYAVSWIGVSLLAGPTFMRGESVQLENLWAIGVPMLAGPFVAGLAMTGLVDGRAGFRDLFSRLARWRVGGRWYVPLLIFPLAVLTVCLALGAWLSPELNPTFFAPGILMGLFAGSVEEIGWMGFAFPRMQTRRSALGTAVWLGLLHALWHALADLLSNYHAFREHWLPYFAGFFLFVTVLRVLIAWVYANTESLFLSLLMHASSSGFLGILVPMDVTPPNRAVFYPVYAVVLSAIALTVAARYGRDLVRKSRQAGSA